MAQPHGRYLNKAAAPHGVRAVLADSCKGCMYERTRTCPLHPVSGRAYWCYPENRLDGCRVQFRPLKRKHGG